MDEYKSNTSMIGGSRVQSRSTSNVSTYVKREEKNYVRRYSMTKKRRSKWIDNNLEWDEDSFLYPSLRKFKAEEAASDPDKREKARILLVSLCAALVMILLIIVIKLATTYLVIEEIRIEGGSYYSEAELLSAGGLKKGDGLPIFKSSDAESLVLNKLPYVKTCEIKFEFPNIVIFHLIDEIPELYTRIEGDYYILNTSLRVLDRTNDQAALSGLLYVEFPRVTKALVGEEIVLEKTNIEYITEFLSLIEESSLKGKLGTVYFDKKFDIVASVDGKFRVLFGSPSDMKLKIAAASKIIEENSEKCLSSGIIDVRIIDICGIILDADIDPEVRE